MNNGCWLKRTASCRDDDLRDCILGCFVDCRLVVCLVELRTGTKRGWRDRGPDGDITVGTSRGCVDGLLLWQCCSVDCTLDECSCCIEVDSALQSLRWTTVAGLNELLAVVMMICVIVYWAASLTVDWLSAWSNYVLEPNAGDATVDPMATSQLVHREVE